MVITFKDFPNIGNYFGREERKNAYLKIGRHLYSKSS